MHITRTPTHYKIHTYTHPHITQSTHTHTHTLQNPHIHTPTHYKIHTFTPTHYKIHTYTHPHITKYPHTHATNTYIHTPTHTLQNPHTHITKHVKESQHKIQTTWSSHNTIKYNFLQLITKIIDTPLPWTKSMNRSTRPNTLMYISWRRDEFLTALTIIWAEYISRYFNCASFGKRDLSFKTYTYSQPIFETFQKML